MEHTVHAPWITAPATRAVIDALTADGADVRFVGGCVRDALLGRESADIDIGTPDPPERVLALLENAGIETRTVPRGIEHGTVTALAGGERYEITTLRRDERTDGRHAEVAFTDDWREDAARRDITINAMSAAPDGTLYDYFGGQEDLKAGRVRFVGDPATRIAEDHLRILRFFRFDAWYGRGEPDDDALAACKDAARTIPSLSGERVQAEMLKLLAAPDPVPAIETMREIGVLAELMPEVQGTEYLARLVAIENNHAEADPVRRLTSLMLDTYYGASDFAALSVLVNRWRLSGDDGARLAALTDLPAALNDDLDARDLRALLYRLGSDRVRDLILMTWAVQDKAGSETTRRAMMETARAWQAPAFPLTGSDVLAQGVDAGPKVGQLLKTVEDWWIERDFAPDRTALLERLDALVAESRLG
ncbi:MAG: CCA tRNA nucleotidyltransferase [Rhodospirillales bacterium]|nr:CCA tRNA nucleotidyltransferase [Rhodospirillales bacterium]